MPDTLQHKESYADFAREAGTAVVTAGQKLKDGVTNNRTEMYILLGTIGFVIVMTLLGYALLTAG